jgi:carbon storage regulator CsrA
MLVLSRRYQESVMVGGGDGFEHLLKVTVLEIKGQNVRLGFEVDESVPVHRWEVWEKRRLANPPNGRTASPRPEVDRPGHRRP